MPCHTIVALPRALVETGAEPPMQSSSSRIKMFEHATAKYIPRGDIGQIEHRNPS